MCPVVTSVILFNFVLPLQLQSRKPSFSSSKVPWNSGFQTGSFLCLEHSPLCPLPGEPLTLLGLADVTFPIPCDQVAPRAFELRLFLYAVKFHVCVLGAGTLSV